MSERELDFVLDTDYKQMDLTTKVPFPELVDGLDFIVDFDEEAKILTMAEAIRGAPLTVTAEEVIAAYQLVATEMFGSDQARNLGVISGAVASRLHDTRSGNNDLH